MAKIIRTKTPSQPHYSEKLQKNLSKMGMTNPINQPYGYLSYEDNPAIDALVQANEYQDTRDIIKATLPNVFNDDTDLTDTYQDTVLDEDGMYRKYSITKDRKTGQVVSKRLINPSDAVSISDVTSGKKPNPEYQQYQTDKLMTEMSKQLNPQTGDFEGSGMNMLETILNGTGLAGRRGVARIFTDIYRPFGGDKNAGRYGTAGMFIGDDNVSINSELNKLYFDNDGNAGFDGTPLNLTPEQKNVFSQYVSGKTQTNVKGFWAQTAAGLGTMTVDLPLYLLGSGVGSNIASKLLPGLAESNIIGSLAHSAVANAIGFNLANTPSMITKTVDGFGSELLDDVWNNAKFGMEAAIFGKLGEGLGNYGSKVLGSYSPLESGDLANILRRNPQVLKMFTGGLSSAALGYMTTEGDYPEKLAQALSFATMHFADIKGWKNYMKGDMKQVMVDADMFKEVQDKVKTGVSLEDALATSGQGLQNYYIKEGDKLTRIDSDKFILNGEVSPLKGEQISITPENSTDYRYITSELPFMKKSIALAWKEAKLMQTIDEVKTKMFSDVKNPYNAETEKDNYESWELNKNLTAIHVGGMIYTDKLVKEMRKNTLPSDTKLQDLITKSSEEFNVPHSMYEKFIKDNYVDYMRDGDKLISDKFSSLPESYRKSLISSLKETEQSFIREYNDKLFRSVFEKDAKPVETKGMFDKIREKLSGIEDEAQRNEAIKAETENLDKVGQEIKTYSDVKEKLDEGYTPAEISEIVKKSYTEPTEVNLPEPKEVPEKALVDEFGKPIESTESKQATAPLNAKDKEIMGIEPKPIMAGEFDKYALTPKPEEIEAKKIEKAKEPETAIPEEPIKTEPEKELVPREAVYNDGETKTPVKVTNEIRDAKGHIKYYEIEDAEGNKKTVFKEKVEFPEERWITKNRREALSNPNIKLSPTPEEEKALQKRGAELEGKEVTAKEFTDHFKKTADPDMIKQWDKFKPVFDLVDKLGIKIKYETLTDPDDKGTRGYYNTRTKELKLNTPLRDEKYYGSNEEGLISTLAHEGIHAILDRNNYKGFNGEEYDKIYDELLNPLISRLKKIYTNDRIKSNIGEDLIDKIEYALNEGNGSTSSDLISMAFTEPAVAKWLDSIPYEGMGAGKSTTFWGALKDNIKQMVKELYGVMFHKSIPKSALDEIQMVMDKVFEMNEMTPENFKPKGIEPEGKIIVGIPDINAIGTPPETAIEQTGKGDISTKGNNETPLKTIYERNSAPNSPEDVKKYATRNLREEYKNERATPVEESKLEDIKKQMEDPSGKIDTKTKRVDDFSDLQSEMNMKAGDSIQKSKLLDGDLKDIQTKAFERIANSPVFKGAKKLTRDYFTNMEVPARFSEMSKRFREGAYKDGEAFIRNVPFYINQVMLNRNGWNQGVDWRDYQLKNKKGALQYLNAFKVYEYGRYNGKIDHDLTWQEFADWAKFTPEQKNLLNRLEIAEKEATKVMKDYKKRMLVEQDANLANEITAKVGRRLLGYTVSADTPKEEVAKIDAKVEETLSKMRGNVTENPELRKVIAEHLVDDVYAAWGRYVHYNAIRPVDPNTVLVELERPNDAFQTAQMKKDNIPGKERISTYFGDMQEAKDYVKGMSKKGWSNTKLYQIKDELHKAGYGALNAHQLMELANKGHVEMNDEIIKRLLEATKKGADLHTANKDYIPGMKYDPVEYENQLNRFVREAITGPIKAYHFTNIQNNLDKWASDLTDAIHSGKLGNETAKAKSAYEYAQRYFNQLKQPEHTFIDGLRGYMMGFHVGFLKPSFLVQQAAQVFQTVLPEAVREHAGVGQSAFWNSFSKSIEQITAINSETKGMDISHLNYDRELFNHLKVLQGWNKLSSAGIDEVFGLTGSIDYHYGSKYYRFSEAFNKVTTSLGKGVERWTRFNSAITAYEVGKAKGLSGEALTEYMGNFVDKTMGEWGKGGRATLLDSAKPNPANHPLVNALKKSAMTYKNFSFYNYGQWHTLLKDKNYSALYTKGLVSLGMAGIKGLPLFASAMMIANLFTDEDMDYKTLRMATELDKIIPQPISNLIEGGMGRWLGADTERMFGGDTPLITDLIANTWEKTWYGKLAEITLGAPLGFSKSEVQAANEMKNAMIREITGDTFMSKKDQENSIRIIKNALPVCFKNAVTAFEWDKDGIVYRNKKIYKRSDLDWLDVTLKALSFPVEKQLKAYNESTYGIDHQRMVAKKIISEAKKYIKEVNNDQEMNYQEKISEKQAAVRSIKQQELKLQELAKKTKITQGE